MESPEVRIARAEKRLREIIEERSAREKRAEMYRIAERVISKGIETLKEGRKMTPRDADEVLEALRMQEESFGVPPASSKARTDRLATSGSVEETDSLAQTELMLTKGYWSVDVYPETRGRDAEKSFSPFLDLPSAEAKKREIEEVCKEKGIRKRIVIEHYEGIDSDLRPEDPYIP